MVGSGRQFDLTDLDIFANGTPHQVFEELRNDDPLHWHAPTEHTPDGEGFWNLTRHDDVTWAAREAELFSSVSGGGRDGGGTLIEDLPLGWAAGVLFNMTDDPRHHHIRRLLTPSLTARKLRDMEVDLARRCDAILDQAVESGSCDLLVDIAAELPVQAIASLMGVPQDDRHKFLEWADATLDYDDRELGAASERSQQAAAEMFNYGGDLLAEKARCPADDMLSIIATADLDDAACPGGPLPELEQQMFFSLLVSAGSDTTRNSITAGLLALMEQPEQWQLLVEQPELVPTAVEEMLRWASSTVYNRRTATTTIERHGATIHAGDKVLLWWASANFDEQVFSNPYQFDVQRDPNPHVAFGLGPHFCIGANLARLEMRLILSGLLERVHAMEVTGPVVRLRSNKHSGYRHVPVRLTPR